MALVFISALVQARSHEERRDDSHTLTSSSSYPKEVHCVAVKIYNDDANVVY
jgi:hypothetical protein